MPPENTHDCDTVKDVIYDPAPPDVFDVDLSPVQRAHFAACPGCRTKRRRFERLLMQMRSPVTSHAPADGPEPKIDGIIDRLKKVWNQITTTRWLPVAVSMALLAVFLTGNGWFSDARADRDPTTEQVAYDFLANRLSVGGDDLLATHSGVSLVDAVDGVAAALDQAGLDPAAKASLHVTLGRVYLRSENNVAAEKHLAAAHDYYRSTGNLRSPEAVQLLTSLCVLYSRQGRAAEVQKLAQQACSIAKEQLGEMHFDTLVAMNNVAAIMIDTGQFEGAAEVLASVVAARDRRPVGGFPSILTAKNFGTLYARQGELDLARRAFADAVAAEMARNGLRDLSTLHTRQQLADIDFRLGRFDQIVEEYEEILQVRLEKLGETDSTLSTMHRLARTYLELGRYEDAEPYLQRLVDVGANRPPSHRDVLNDRFYLARLFEETGRFFQAEQILAENYRVCREAWGVEHKETDRQARALIGVYEAWGNESAAEQIRRELIGE